MTRYRTSPGAAGLYLAAALAALLFARPGFAADPMRLLSATGGGVTFEVSPGEPVLTPYEEGGVSLVQLTMPDFAIGGEMLEPALPERIVWIGIPEGADVVVRGISQASREIDGVRLLPRVPRPEILHPLDEGATPSDPTKIDPAMLRTSLASDAYAASRIDAPVAELAYITGMRDQRVAAVRVRPATCDARGQRVRIHQKIFVDVRFVGGRAPGSSPGPDPAFERVYEDLLLNYESAKAFRRPTGGANAERSRFRTAQDTGVHFDAASQWVKVGVFTKGIQRIDGASLEAVGVNLGAIDATQLRVYTRPGVPLLDEVGFCDTCWLSELAIEVSGTSGSSFDRASAVLFYGLPVSGWRDDYLPSASNDSLWLDHPYETTNYYWLTWTSNAANPPKRWTDRTVTPGPGNAWQAPFHGARAHFERNFFYEPNLYDPRVFWDQWAYQLIDQGLGGQIFRGDAIGAVDTEPYRFRMRQWGRSFETLKTLPDHVLRVRVNGNDAEDRQWNGPSRMDVDTTFSSGLVERNNELRLEVPLLQDPVNSGRQDRQALLFWELHYKSRFTPEANRIEFSSGDSLTMTEFVVGPFSSNAIATLQILDVTDPINPVRLQGVVPYDTTGGGVRVIFHDDVTELRRYFGASAIRFVKPRVELADIRPIRRAGPGPNYLIITYDGYESQAQSLAEHRRQNLFGYANPRVEVVRISDVLAWYAGGRMDPTAIRNYLYDMTTSGLWAEKPAYVCFLGDASYDFKNILGFAPSGVPPNRVPTYVHGFFSRQFLSDDWLVDLDIGPFDPPPDGTLGSEFQNMPDFFVGRLPAASPAEATTLVEEKVIPYDESPNFGEWRNRAILLADDFVQGLVPDNLGGVHLSQTDSLEGGHIHESLERRKIYMNEYPQTGGGFKPEVNREVIRRVNEGALLWNYFGHGNPFQMADEQAFRVSDVPTLTNLDRLTLCIAASCDLGKFDSPDVLGMGEALVKSSVGGSIATFSASEIAFSGQNLALATAFFDGLFASPEQGFPNSLGQSVYVAKYRRIPRINDRKYTLQGDPATRLGYPVYDVRMELFDDETGVALTDSMPRGKRIRMEAEVHGTRDRTVEDLRSDFDGEVAIRISDSAPVQPYELFTSVAYYTGNPSSIYRGSASVEDGRATVRFYVPLEARVGDYAEAKLYASNAAIDGSGGILLRTVDGEPTVVDTTGPEIDLFFTRGSDFVPPDAELRIVLRDEHGINITGTAAPNRIVLTINDAQQFDLTEAFRYEANSYQVGSVLFRLPNLPNGNHRLRISATDNFARGILSGRNRSERELDFTVSSAADEAVSRTFAFPNPFVPSQGTQIIFDGVSQASDIEVKIYTVTGEIIRSLRVTDGPGQVQIGWDGRDDAGGAVSNGVYLYRAQLRPIDGGPTVQIEGRMAASR